MLDHEQTRQRFEDHCWQHYMAERQRRDMPGDVPDAFPTREQLFWRMTDGRYGVLMFNAGWLAWCWAMGEKGAKTSKCAQCKAEYRRTDATEGCPKCAPGTRISENEFQKPLGDHRERNDDLWRLGRSVGK